MIVFKRLVDVSKARGIECQLLTPRELEKV